MIGINNLCGNLARILYNWGTITTTAGANTILLVKGAFLSDPLHVLVTGATGTIGGALLRRWAALGIGRLGEVQLTGLVRSPSSPAAQALDGLGIRLASADLADPGAVRAALNGQQVVVHAAGGLSPQAAAGLYHAASEAGVQRLIAFSSLLVYGSQALAGEDNLPQVTGHPHTDLCLDTERALRAAEAAGRTQVLILRLAPVYGPGVPRWTVEPVTQAQRRRLGVPGSGAYAFPYLYIGNLVDAVTAAVAAQSCDTVDVFDGVTTYAEFMGHYARMTGTRLRSQPLPLLMGAGWLQESLGRVMGRAPQFTRGGLRSLLRTLPIEPPRAEKALRELGWQPRVSLEEGMAVIEHSNGFHRRGEAKSEPNPWAENAEWKDEDHASEGG